MVRKGDCKSSQAKLLHKLARPSIGRTQKKFINTTFGWVNMSAGKQVGVRL
jgi:hypothetical protein